MSQIYINKFKDISLQGGALNIGVGQIKELPIIIPNSKVSNSLEKLAQKINDLYKDLNTADKDSDEWDKLKVEIQKTDNLINQKVYELYGLNKKEIEIIGKGV
jgi:arsenate reductase-like glutaredoxin family protein